MQHYHMASEFPSVEEVLDQATVLFKQEFSSIPDVAVCAPDVINLIGEHNDHHDGLSMLIALETVTIIVGQRNSSENICVISTWDKNYPKVNFNTTNISPGNPPWANCIKGAIKMFPDAVPGFNALIITSMLSQPGFSSRASLLVATYTFLEAMMHSYATNPSDKAIACHQAEKEYFDTTCGISSPIMSIFGEHRKVLFLDTRTLERRLLAVDNYNITFVMLMSDTYSKIELSDVQAHIRHCNVACEKIGKKSLRDATLDELLGIKNHLDPEVFNSARYAISENIRAINALKALETKDYLQFGKLMSESHMSLRNDWGVACDEINQLMEIIQNYNEKQKDSVLGARMSSIIGCVLIMINRSDVNGFMDYIWTNCNGKIPAFYALHPSYGSRILRTSFRTDFI